jgi:ribose transport system permease protein
MSFTDTITYWRYRLIPDHLLGEILAKRWIDNAIPFLILVLVVATFGSLIPGFFSLSSLATLTRQLGEVGLVVLAMMIVMVAGGIDLSVGSTFALANIVALALLNVAGWPVAAVIVATLATGALVGLVNGVLVGYLRLRAFLTTLVTLIIVRSIVDTLLLHYSVDISAGFVDSDLWSYLGDGTILSLPFSLIAFAVLAVIVHLVLSRSKIGWHIMAIGGSRRNHRADRGRPGRQQPWRRPRVRRQGGDRRDRRGDHGQWAGAPRCRQRG